MKVLSAVVSRHECTMDTYVDQTAIILSIKISLNVIYGNKP